MMRSAADLDTPNGGASRRIVKFVRRYLGAPQPPYPAPFWRVLIQSRAALPDPEAEPSLCALPLALRPFVDTPDGAP
jgi:hypothetical protein